MGHSGQSRQTKQTQSPSPSSEDHREILSNFACKVSSVAILTSHHHHHCHGFTEESVPTQICPYPVVHISAAASPFAKACGCPSQEENNKENQTMFDKCFDCKHLIE